MKRGSALLVVLGMLTFMLFSGMAFSVYMRYSRLPTSFVRRTSTTRQLTKAALAEAIDDIDIAIGNDPHPGVMKYNRGSGVENIWSHRVFIGTRSTSSNNSNAQSEQTSSGITPGFADSAETVPTMPLEGLAYLPPNLINEVRYYSQITPTAKWHSFWFDSGRYAYTAIDVSDYFDVNRIFTDKPRAASASRRLSFAHLFEESSGNDRHTSAGTGADKWDTFMKKVRDVDSKTDAITYKEFPFVSMADFNIAWGSQDLGGLKCPFYGFVKEGRPYDCGEAEDDPDAEKYRGMTFVTDGWYPVADDRDSSNNKVIHCDLAGGSCQPFKSSALMKEDTCPSIDEIAKYAYSDSQAKNWMENVGNGSGLRLNHVNIASLWDYLDVDSVPLSLCVPTVERTPMICGIRPSFNGEIELTLTQSPARGDMGSDKDKETVMIGSDQWDVYSREITYSLDATKLTSALGDVRVMMLYPFRDHEYQSAKVDTTWKLDGRLSAFFTTGEMPGRVSADSFTAYPKKDAFEKNEVTDKSLISYKATASSDVTASAFENGDREKPCALGQLKFERESIDASSLVLFKVTYRWARDKYDRDSNGSFSNPHTVNSDPAEGLPRIEVKSIEEGKLFALNTSGSRVEWKSVCGNTLDQEVDLKFNCAVWVRLMNDQKVAVDFVPACQTDDINMNDGEESKCARECGGSGYYPLMRTVATGEIKLSRAKLLATTPTLGTATFPDVKWIISDPRYNYAPENWVQTENGGALQTTDWTDDADIKKQIESGDGDIFMATSDVGYMQSIYELAMLPRVSEGFTDSAKGSAFYGNLGTTFDGKFATTHAGAKDANFMWRTYDPFGRYAVGEFSELDTIFVSQGGLKVNPYSDSKSVLMAAFANTPHDWRLAATNDTSLFQMKAAAFNAKHAWNAYSTDTDGKMCWDCLEEFAETFADKVRSTDDWEDALASLGWSRDKRKILDSMEELDTEDSNLYAVDKKFLYGFWHDCFAARQQLFLIFVRAEPMMMGGGVKGQIPPQLGAKAVALVWRDPTETKSDARTVDGVTLANPHRTRILFYHQFD